MACYVLTSSTQFCHQTFITLHANNNDILIQVAEFRDIDNFDLSIASERTPEKHKSWFHLLDIARQSNWVSTNSNAIRRALSIWDDTYRPICVKFSDELT